MANKIETVLEMIEAARKEAALANCAIAMFSHSELVFMIEAVQGLIPKSQPLETFMNYNDDPCKHCGRAKRFHYGPGLNCPGLTRYTHWTP